MLELTAELTPTRLPPTPCGVRLRMELRNAGKTVISIAPEAAKLDAVASFAGAGVTWGLEIERVRIRELRTYYGPPGNPPAPSALAKLSKPLAPGASQVIELPAAWIPASVLEPRHFANLDRTGMDNLGDVSGSSVLVFHPGKLDRSADDFLRGHVVAFFPAPGTYELRVSYAQGSWMGVGERHRASAPPIEILV